MKRYYMIQNLLPGLLITLALLAQTTTSVVAQDVAFLSGDLLNRTEEADMRPSHIGEHADMRPGYLCQPGYLPPVIASQLHHQDFTVPGRAQDAERHPDVIVEVSRALEDIHAWSQLHSIE